MLSEEDDEPEFFKTLADPQVRTTFHKINVIKDEILGLHLRESHFDEDIDDDDNDEGLACNDPQREGLLYKAYWGIFNLREGKKTLFENCCH